MIASQLRRPFLLDPTGETMIQTPNGLQTSTGEFSTEPVTPVLYLSAPIVSAPSAVNPAPAASASPAPGQVYYLTNADGTQTPVSASDYAQIVASQNGVTAASTTSIWSTTIFSIPLWVWAIGAGLYFFMRGKK